MIVKQVYCRSWAKVVTSRYFSKCTSTPVLPKGSFLHRINEHFTPIAEADPEFDIAALARSVERRGLTEVFPSEYLERLDKQARDIRAYEKELQHIEARRLRLHDEYQEASSSGNAALQDQLRAASKLIKKEKNKLKELHRTLAFNVMEDLLKLPNRLREAECSLPPETLFSQTSTPTSLQDAIRATDLDTSIVNKDCGTYYTGKLADFRHEMSRLLAVISGEVEKAMGTPALRCSLSDFVRLPVAEACAWTPSLDEVIQIQHTKDDVIIPKPGDQPLINPYTRLCLVGSASLAAFAGSFFNGCLNKEARLPLRFLTVGNIYNYGPPSRQMSYPFKQTLQISFFGLDSDEYSSAATCDNLVTVIGKFWSRAQPHWNLRLHTVSVGELRKCEMSRWRLALAEPGKPEVEVSSCELALSNNNQFYFL
uniref:Seryl-tRNA synthetase n=1 Tax=Mesocestoides corti TaxID=53468 RepID=A0A5K3F9Y2_MESCO